ncbi:MAG: hypothetical protein QOJ99_1663 [Bryobacterales bacterium]|jgi:hypothetical protein|nr:hypothetical protein [Bryobacterales bacterium]
MKPFLVLFAVMTAATPALGQRRAYLPYAGRWDLNIETPSESFPPGWR